MPAPSPLDFRVQCRAFLRLLRKEASWGYSAWPKKLGLGAGADLHQTAGSCGWLIGRAARHVRIVIFVEQGSPNGVEETAEGAERVIYGAGFIPAVNHAIGAFGIAAFGAVVFPIRFAN